MRADIREHERSLKPAQQTLDLSTNALGDQGITALADALTANSTLTFLDVHACGIHDSGATALAGALQNNCTLAVLNLKANYITDAGAIALAQVAIKSKTLKALITTSNDIERAGEKALEVVCVHVPEYLNLRSRASVDSWVHVCLCVRCLLRCGVLLVFSFPRTPCSAS